MFVYSFRVHGRVVENKWGECWGRSINHKRGGLLGINGIFKSNFPLFLKQLNSEHTQKLRVAQRDMERSMFGITNNDTVD